MIIQCPKCKTKFEIDENFIKNSEMKFQCSDCSYVWVEKFENSAVEQERQQENVIEKSVKQEQIPACLVSDNDVEKNTEKKSVFNTKNIMIVVLALFLFLVVFLLTQFVVQDFSSSNRSNSGFFRKSEEKKLDKLYIELIKPLALTKEGVNEYIIIRGIIYNPTNITLPIPKLSIKLENASERVLQEQEREVEVKELAPLGKTEFLFKVFKNSSQVHHVKVEFIEDDKI